MFKRIPKSMRKSAQPMQTSQPDIVASVRMCELSSLEFDRPRRWFSLLQTRPNPQPRLKKMLLQGPENVKKNTEFQWNLLQTDDFFDQR